jgi:polyisoprenoid-binding protein YceI
MNKTLINKTLILFASSLFLSNGFSVVSIADNTMDKKVTISPSDISLEWKGEKVTGEHTGTVQLKSGEVSFNGTNLIGAKFDIDMSTIAVVDIKDPKYNKKLTDHLLSEDFFGVDKHKSATITVTKSTPVADKDSVELSPGKKSNYNLDGVLKIKDIEHPISFPALISVENGVANAYSVVKVDRTKYNIKYGSGKFFDNLGDKLIYDIFTVSVNAKAKI